MVTLADKSGYSRSRRDRGCWPIYSVAGEWLVVDCGNIRYRAKTHNNRVSRSPGTFLMVCTVLSASPFEEGWYDAYLTCLMPFKAQNLENSSLVKLPALSDTITCGLPCVANVRRCIVSVFDEDDDDITYASIYLLWGSTIIRIYLPLIGPS